MKLILYYKGSQNQTNQVMQAAFNGALKLGFMPVWRNSTDFNAENIEEADMVFLWGLPRKTCNREILQCYRQLDIPVLISDLGYLKRGFNSMTPDAYYQIGINQLNWLPPCECNDDRFQRLELPLSMTKRFLDETSPILLCGQVPNDAQHGMSEKHLKAWLFRTLVHVKEYTQRPVIWRPHPLAPFEIKGADALSDSRKESLADALNKAYALISYNSTSGIEALLHGVPVFCDAKASCTYLEVANLNLAKIVKPQFPTQKISQFFCRLAYAQWTKEEIARGDAFTFLMGLLKKEVFPL